MKKLTLIQQSVFSICIFGAILILNIIALAIKNNSEIFKVSSTGISVLTVIISIRLLLVKKELKDEATYETLGFATRIAFIFILCTLLLVAIMLIFLPQIAISFKAVILYFSMIFIVFYAAVIQSEIQGKRGYCDE